jgi:hypothetical protein
VRSPDVTLERAHLNLSRMRQAHPDGMAARWIAQWQKILSGGVDQVLAVLTARTSTAADLRQNSPFAGVLSEEERHRVTSAFRAHWLREHVT